MSPEHFRQIEAIFDAAVDAATNQRAAVLERLCGADAGLRIEVESLLAALPGAPTPDPGGHRQGGQPGDRDRAPLPEAPVRIGPYRLVCELGRGGMGTVPPGGAGRRRVPERGRHQRAIR